MARRPIDTAAWSKNWKSGMDSAGPNYTKGVMSCEVDPMEQAAQKAEKMKQGVIQAVDSGRYQKGCRSVSKSQWQQQSTTLGAPRLSSGAAAALPKLNNKIALMAPKMDALRATIDSMPNDTVAEREARNLAWSRGMAAIKASL